MPERSTEEKKAVILVTGGLAQGKLDWALARSGYTTVSYTHLTLPTILRV